ncbi:MAG: OsmC family protein [Calditrichia bacterium]
MTEIFVKQVEGLTFVGRGNTRHWIPMDGPETFGGSDAANRPMELFLMSLAGCSGADVASLLKKMRVDYDGFEIFVKGERAEEHPRVFTRINLMYKLIGGKLSGQKELIEKAIRLSQDKYCSVSAMIRAAGIPINHSYELVEKAPI